MTEPLDTFIAIPSESIPRAVTFDFFDTLVHHRSGKGRGARYRDYLRDAGFESAPWEHRVLYDVFEYYGAVYDPDLSDEGRLAFWTELTRRLFERTKVQSDGPVDYADHAPAIRDIMGPRCLAVFDDVFPVLEALKLRGIRLGVVDC